MFRKPADLMLAEDHLAVDFDIKDSAGSFDEFALYVDGVPDRCCQTGSLWRVVSHHAVGDTDFHGSSCRGSFITNSMLHADWLKVSL